MGCWPAGYERSCRADLGNWDGHDYQQYQIELMDCEVYPQARQEPLGNKLVKYNSHSFVLHGPQLHEHCRWWSSAVCSKHSSQDTMSPQSSNPGNHTFHNNQASRATTLTTLDQPNTCFQSDKKINLLKTSSAISCMLSKSPARLQIACHWSGSPGFTRLRCPGHYFNTAPCMQCITTMKTSRSTIVTTLGSSSW